jgi:hypothetical protein
MGDYEEVDISFCDEFGMIRRSPVRGDFFNNGSIVYCILAGPVGGRS